METGPLARMWVNGDYRTGISVMDRHHARALEAQKIANAMVNWLGQIVVGGSEYQSYTTPYGVSGVGLTEAPRGALGHWLSIATSGTTAPNGTPAIGSYQVITPTCWNASPKDTNGIRGPLEQALIGTKISNPSEPIEVLRVIHSYDPCLSCAVHVMRPNGKPIVVTKPR
jgi:hydrogenase large subunit